MESVMDFLASYYIGFFIAAGILSFALIGFIIESKRKQKNDFKGEEVDENKDKIESTPVVTNENVNVLGNTVDMNGDVNIKEETNNLPDIETVNEMPINNELEEINENDNVEFYSGPVEMPKVEPAPSYIKLEEENEMQSDTTETENGIKNNHIIFDEVRMDMPMENIVEPATITNIETNIPEPQITENIENIDNISMDNTLNTSEIGSTVEPEKKEEINIFDNLN